MLSSQQFLVLALVVGRCHDLRVLAMIRADLGIENQPLIIPKIKEAILAKAKPRKELCIGCLEPTIYGDSFELQVGCSNCGSQSLWQLGHQLGLELEGEDRKVLMQFIYQTLEEIGVIECHY